LLAERRALDAELSAIKSAADATRRSLMVTGSVQSQELVASDAYLRRLAADRRRQEGRIGEWQSRAVRQREAVLEARRRLRLMEQLEERRFREWKAAIDREQENLSAELYLARWKRD